MYCYKNCKYLNITEKEQDEKKSKREWYPYHFCTLYEVQLFHYGEHPQIYKFLGCEYKLEGK